MMQRRATRQIHVGKVAVGGDAPISVQSMTITKTADVEGTLQQIYALAAAGCDIVRCTCNEAAAAEGLAQIVPRSPIPIIGIAGLVDGYASDGRHVEWTWVDSAHRHRGIFRALLKALIDRESGNGAYDIALWVLENNQVARKAYARLRFEPTGERQRLSDGRYELRLRLPITRRS